MKSSLVDKYDLDLRCKFAQTIWEHFGYDSYHPFHLKIVNNLINQKRHVCAVIEPGFGSSLCYQYVAVAQGLVLVVSELTHSIWEQTRFLNVRRHYLLTVLSRSYCWLLLVFVLYLFHDVLTAAVRHFVMHLGDSPARSFRKNSSDS